MWNHHINEEKKKENEKKTGNTSFSHGFPPCFGSWNCKAGLRGPGLGEAPVRSARQLFREQADPVEPRNRSQPPLPKQRPAAGSERARVGSLYCEHRHRLYVVRDTVHHLRCQRAAQTGNQSSEWTSSCPNESQLGHLNPVSASSTAPEPAVLGYMGCQCWE